MMTTPTTLLWSHYYLSVGESPELKKSIDDVPLQTPITNYEELVSFELPNTLGRIEQYVKINRIFEKYAYHRNRTKGAQLSPPFRVTRIADLSSDPISEGSSTSGARTIAIFIDGSFVEWEDFCLRLRVAEEGKGALPTPTPYVPCYVDSQERMKMINCDYTSMGLVTDKIAENDRETQEILLKKLLKERERGQLFTYLTKNTIYHEVVSPPGHWEFEVLVTYDPRKGIEGSHTFARLTTPDGCLYSFGLWRLDEPRLKQNQRPNLEIPDRTETLITGLVPVSGARQAQVECFGGAIEEGAALKILSKILFDYRNEHTMVYSLIAECGLTCSSWLVQAMNESHIALPASGVSMTVLNYLEELPLPWPLKSLINQADQFPGLKKLILFWANYHFTQTQKLHRVSSPLAQRGVPALVAKPSDLERNHSICCPHLLALELSNRVAKTGPEVTCGPWKFRRKFISSLERP